MKLKVNDLVKVVAGKDKGKDGKITKIIPKDLKVIVEGANKYKRHLKRQSKENPGGIVEVERPLPIANVQLICPSCKQITRVSFKGVRPEKVRVCAKCEAPLQTK